MHEAAETSKNDGVQAFMNNLNGRIDRLGALVEDCTSRACENLSTFVAPEPNDVGEADAKVEQPHYPADGLIRRFDNRLDELERVLDMLNRAS